MLRLADIIARLCARMILAGRPPRASIRAPARISGSDRPDIISLIVLLAAHFNCFYLINGFSSAIVFGRVAKFASFAGKQIKSFSGLGRPEAGPAY